MPGQRGKDRTGLRRTPVRVHQRHQRGVFRLNPRQKNLRPLHAQSLRIIQNDKPPRDRRTGHWPRQIRRQRHHLLPRRTLRQQGLPTAFGRCHQRHSPASLGLRPRQRHRHPGLARPCGATDQPQALAGPLQTAHKAPLPHRKRRGRRTIPGLRHIRQARPRRLPRAGQPQPPVQRPEFPLQKRLRGVDPDVTPVVAAAQVVCIIGPRAAVRTRQRHQIRMRHRLHEETQEAFRIADLTRQRARHLLGPHNPLPRHQIVNHPGRLRRIVRHILLRQAR